MPLQPDTSTEDKTLNKTVVSSILVMMFIIVLIVFVIVFITESAYLATVSYPYVILALLVLFTFTKSIIMTAYKIWYPLILLGALLFGGWCLSSTDVATARTGAIVLAALFIIDAAYSAYVLKSDNKVSSNTMYVYGFYGNVIVSVVLALMFGYAAI